MSEPQSDTQVLIAGGGPTGLSAAVELSVYGIDTVVIEPRTYVSHTNPRAKLTNIRTMEHFRRWGVADRIREEANLPVDWSQEVVFCTALLGDEIARFDNVFGMKESPDYAEPAQQMPQFLTEDVLRAEVVERSPSSLHTGWKVTALEQDAESVRATVENCIERKDIGHGESREITAEYLLGCDGAKSTVREEIGSTFEGEANPRKNLGVVFRAPNLADRHELGPAVHYWTLSERVQGFMGRLDLDETWWMIAVGVDDPTNLDPRPLIFEMVGEKIDATVMTTDPWSAKMLLVDRSHVGRVFLVGDAAHLNPPWGGHGYNTGVGDAVDIGWKLAAVLNGWGGQTLLESYEPERRGVHEAVIEVSGENMQSSPADLLTDYLDEDGNVATNSLSELADDIYEKKKMEFHSLGLVLGYRYDDSPIIVDDDSTGRPERIIEFEPTCAPGARLPHSWIHKGGDFSIYDTLGKGLSLIRFDRGVDVSPMQGAATKLQIPFDVIDLDGEELTHAYERPLLLVRPDQHIAWQGTRCPDDPESILETVAGRT